MDMTQILLAPVVSEKATSAREQSNQVVFVVHPKANKIEIKRAVETAFSVTVETVNVVNRKPEKKMRNRRMTHIAGVRKAYVTLAAGQKIDLFEGV